MRLSGSKPKPTRILRVIARMNVGGPAVQVTALMQNLPKEKYSQKLLAGLCEPDESDYLELHAVSLNIEKIRTLGRRISILDDAKTLSVIRSHIKSFKADIVHTHTFKAGLLGRIATLSLWNRPKIVHTFHGHLLHGYATGLKLRLLKLAERQLAKRTDILVSVGYRVMEELIEEKIGIRKQFRVIPPGFSIPQTQCPPIIKRQLDGKNKEFHCVWIGRIVEVKKPERIIEVARALRQINSKVDLIVVGDGEKRKTLEEQCSVEGLPVKFMGWQKNVFEILESADALLLTSANEGTPVSIIEAQMMGKPVVATDVGSVSEVLRNGVSGFALDYDALRFAQILDSFASNSILYKQFALNAKEFGQSNFSVERLAKQYDSLYQEVMNS